MENPEDHEDPFIRKEEMATGGPMKNPKKANLLDPHSIKHLLDESVTKIVMSHGYMEDMRLNNLRLLIGSIIIAIALTARFYPKKPPQPLSKNSFPFSSPSSPHLLSPRRRSQHRPIDSVSVEAMEPHCTSPRPTGHAI